MAWFWYLLQCGSPRRATIEYFSGIIISSTAKYFFKNQTYSTYTKVWQAIFIQMLPISIRSNERMLPWLRFLIHFYVQCLDHVDILIAFFCRTHIHIYRWFQAESLFYKRMCRILQHLWYNNYSSKKPHTDHTHLLEFEVPFVGQYGLVFVCIGIFWDAPQALWHIVKSWTPLASLGLVFK